MAEVTYIEAAEALKVPKAEVSIKSGIISAVNVTFFKDSEVAEAAVGSASIAEASKSVANDPELCDSVAEAVQDFEFVAEVTEVSEVAGVAVGGANNSITPTEKAAEANLFSKRIKKYNSKSFLEISLIFSNIFNLVRRMSVLVRGSLGCSGFSWLILLGFCIMFSLFGGCTAGKISDHCVFLRLSVGFRFVSVFVY